MRKYKRRERRGAYERAILAELDREAYSEQTETDRKMSRKSHKDKGHKDW